jgi:hypothetical protein
MRKSVSFVMSRKSKEEKEKANKTEETEEKSLREVLLEHGFNFESKLAKVITESDELNEKLHKRVMNNRSRGKMKDRDLLLYKNNRQDLIGALKTLTQYIYPKLKTVETDQGPGQQPVFNISIGGEEAEEDKSDDTPSDNVISLVSGK